MKKTIKKSVALLLTAVMLLSVLMAAPFTVSAESDYEHDEFDVEIKSDGSCSITSYYGRYGVYDVVLPSSINGHKITEIGNSAFSHCPIKSIVIPDSVTKLDEDAFRETRNLKSVVLSNKLQSIGDDCFAFSGIENIIIPNSVTKLSEGVFAGCTNLKSVVLSNKLQSIGDDCFAFSGIENIIIPNSVTKLDEDAFRETRNLKSVVLSNKLQSIGDRCFESSGIESIAIPDSVTELGRDVFCDCKNLKSLKLGNGIPYTLNTELRFVLFYYFDYLDEFESFTVSEGNKMFSGKDGVLYDKNKTEILVYPNGKKNESFDAPSTLKAIPDDGFSHNRYLKIISIPINDKSNVVSQSYLGYYWDNDKRQYVKKEDFTIKAYKGTSYEKYAKDNGFKFVELVAPTSVKLNTITAKRGVGESGTLTPILTPSNATTTYTWTSSNTKVATVTNGKVTAKNAGTATITVKTSNGKTASCKVTVYNAPNSVKLNLTSAKLGVGESYTLKATLPANTYSRLAWSSSNTKVATVKNGKLVAKAKGTTTITVKTSNGKTATCKLTVYPAPTSVKLNVTSVTIGVGEKFTISETVNKGAYACTPNLKWSTANSKVAAIAKGKSNTAVITGKKAGTTTVKITLYNGKTATCKVTVKAAPKSVKLNKTAITLKKGQKYTLTYGVNSGAYANPFNTKWSSNNTKGVTVAKGSANKCVVTAKNKGTATITVKTYNGKTAKCKVTVK